MNKALLKAILLLIGGAGIALSGMNWHIGITAWIAPIFLLMYTREAKWIHFIFFFLTMFVVGVVSQTGSNLLNLPAVHVSNGLSFGITYIIPFIIDKALYKKSGYYYYSLLFPSAFVLIEYAISPLAGTWGSIAHTQYEFKSLMQISSVTGIYGVTFMVYWFASVVNWVIEKKSESKTSYKGIFIYGGILCIVLFYGKMRISFSSENIKTTKVAAIISETDVHKIAEKEEFKKLLSDYDGNISNDLFSDSLSIEKLVNRTNKASGQGAKVIVWNEIALILNQKQKTDLVSKIQSLCLKERVYVLLAFLEESPDKTKKPFNNVSIFVSPEGEIIWEYLKSFLHPVAEAPIVNAGNFELPTSQTEFGKLGNVICVDLDITNYIKQAGKQSVDILLVPAFDWEGITPLHSEMACVQAIQHGFSLVRANGKGVTAIYDYMGNSIASSNTLTSDTKIINADVPIKSAKTIYSRIGDIIILLTGLFMVISIIKRVIKRNR